MPKLHFTESAIKTLPYSNKKPIDYQDTEQPGFILRVGASVKTYYVRRRMGGHRKRIKIGDARTISLKEARNFAAKIMTSMMMTEAESSIQPLSGSSPLMQVEYRSSPITLETAFHDIAELAALDRTKARGYLSCLNGPLADVKDRLLTELNTVDVLRLHQQITGLYGMEHADRCLRALNDVLNFAMMGYRNAAGDALVRHNPVAYALVHL